MSKKFTEYKELNLSQINKDVLAKWKAEHTFAQSLDLRKGCTPFVFYEGPPSANGMPGIHHVMARAIKDIFCRYKTQKGFLVNRKAGWDTHGLPVELSVEKMLGITKEDIGKKISVDEYNAACRKEVMKYTREWENLTEQMGYWVDMSNPYITYDNRYIETLWHLLKELYKKNLLYKGYTIQPYSPAAGTGLSTHELNQPGCYRDVKDTTCVAMFTVPVESENADLLNRAFGSNAMHVPGGWGGAFFLAWTTTPWTLPSNTALCVGPNIDYVAVQTHNSYSGEKTTVILAKDLVAKHFNPKAAGLKFEDYKPGNKLVPYKIVGECKGKDLEGIQYRQLMPWVNPGNGAFRVITGDFVTTEDGTGIVHIAPTFGADDDRVAKQHGVPPLMLVDKNGIRQPMVDKTGKFFKVEDLDGAFVKESMNLDLYTEYAGRFVKNAYDPKLTEDDATLDVDLCVMLKQQGLAFKIEKYVHSYPHCWRTDKPVLYYPLDSWFIKTTACKDRMVELNKTIGWKPESTGTGRFGKWLEDLKDWNLSRSRYWGTPLPIWRTEDGSEEKCVGSVEELYGEIEKATASGVMKSNPYKDKGFIPNKYEAANYEKIDLHRPYVDGIILVSDNGQPMKRELDLIDVWFDSGAMPFAQDHYPLEGGTGRKVADFIAEGVDQTRGWFFTLHAISTMIANEVSFKNVISNGLVLDKNGNKMSKRLGNAVEPFKVMEDYGSDALRWYMVTNSQPWDNLKFDIDGVDEVRRKFFGTLYNTYSFFALYANIDRFTGAEKLVTVSERPEIDRWIISLLNTLVKEVEEAYEAYEPTRAGRLIQDFVGDNLSNWYVRLNRKRFWGGNMTQNKLAAYQTLHECLMKVVLLAAPIAPFITDRIFCDINAVSGESKVSSVHLADFPEFDNYLINKELENKMQLAQQATSMILALRRKVNIRVRQPLQRAVLAVADPEVVKLLTPQIKDIVKAETNVKDLQVEMEVVAKRAKANFKTLGAKCGKNMKEVAAQILTWQNTDVLSLESRGEAEVALASGERVLLTPDDVEVITESIPGYECATEGKLTLALDITVTEALRQEGIARELVNRIQNLRKDSGFEVTDRINIYIQKRAEINDAVTTFADYIKGQVLGASLKIQDSVNEGITIEIEDYTVEVKVSKI
ncbi:MAG: isoleucine--tRNA ligase [Prevotellaceae bacterium]|jgi:isoleucyl-tRNA synthetase|nr:isoleucine--tRNA ligase [Prevotellaceae bacterium]